jgi:hypothetical protein
MFFHFKLVNYQNTKTSLIRNDDDVVFLRSVCVFWNGQKQTETLLLRNSVIFFNYFLVLQVKITLFLILT